MMNARITQAAQLMAASAPLNSIFGCIVGQARGGEVNSIRGALNSMLITLDRGGKKRLNSKTIRARTRGSQKLAKLSAMPGWLGREKHVSHVKQPHDVCELSRFCVVLSFFEHFSSPFSRS
jgi:hypothetical protein